MPQYIYRSIRLVKTVRLIYILHTFEQVENCVHVTSPLSTYVTYTKPWKKIAKILIFTNLRLLNPNFVSEIYVYIWLFWTTEKIGFPYEPWAGKRIKNRQDLASSLARFGTCRNRKLLTNATRPDMCFTQKRSESIGTISIIYKWKDIVIRYK